MLVRIDRRYKLQGYTIGNLYVDGVAFCDTLEDTDRGLMQGMSADYIRKVKAAHKGATAIPRGRYEVTLSVTSPKFAAKSAYQFCGGKLPRLLNVTGYDGVLIHIGNTPSDTEGCVLVGRNTVKGKVLESTATFRALYARMKAAAERGERITIEIA